MYVVAASCCRQLPMEIAVRRAKDSPIRAHHKIGLIMTLCTLADRSQAAFIALFLLLTLSACSTMDVGSHYDETTNFTAYRSFSWVADDPYISDGDAIRISPLTQQKIQDTIASKFANIGIVYTATPDDADIIVAYTVGTRDKIRTASYPIDYPGNWGWHVHGSHYYVREVSEHKYTEGTLAIDVFDGRTQKPVWHGWAQKTITTSDRQDPDPLIEESVSRLLESFPK